MRIPKIIPDFINELTGRWSTPGAGYSKGKPRLHLDYADRAQRDRQTERTREETLSREAQAAQRGGGKNRNRFRRGGKVGGLEKTMVPDMKFSSYYGRPIVKAPPWGWPIGVYLWLGGISGSAGVLALGAQLTGNHQLGRPARLTAFTAAGLGSLALVGDLGRPERALNMFRVFKVSSPMSMGSYILMVFASSAALPAATEIDQIMVERGRGIELPDWLRRTARSAGRAATPVTGVLGPLLATYTGVLLSDTSVPAWAGAKSHLPYIFGSSGALAGSGVLMALTDPDYAGPARVLALVGSGSELYAMHQLKEEMDPTIREVYEKDAPGTLLKASEVMVMGGAVGTAGAVALQALGRNSRPLSVLSGIALVIGSGLTRFGVLHAGHNSVKDPKYVVQPQKRRMERDREAGLVDGNITTLS